MISKREQELRRHDVDTIIASTLMEGGTVTPEARDNLERWVAGELSGDEVVALARQQLGLEPE